MGKRDQRIYRVFISSTYLDNAVRRRSLIEEIGATGSFQTIAMERFTADDRETTTVCLERVREADVFIGIIAWRYGWIPEGETRAITELEYEAADGMPRLMFLIDVPEDEVKLSDLDPEPGRYDKQKQLIAFKDRIRSDRAMYTPFKDDTLASKVCRALLDWRDRKEGRTSPRSEAVKAPEPGSLSPSDIDAYVAFLENEYDRLPILGFNTRVRVKLRLEDIFVPLRVVLDRTKSGPGGFDCGEDADALAHHRENEELSLVDALRRADELGGARGLVVLGDPGSGKTTHLKRLLIWALRTGPADLGIPAESTPFLFPLRDLRPEDKSLRAFATRLVEAATDDPDTAKELWTRDVPRLVLLDGLDEVPADRRGEVKRWIERELRKRKDDRFVVTCRYAGYKGDARLDADFLELHLRPLDADQARTFVERWFELVECDGAPDERHAKAEAEKKSAALLERLRDKDFRASRVFSMTRNPLLLTAICLVQYDRGQLPRRRVDLYEECVITLLQRWREAKGLPILFDAKKALPVLQPLALFLHEQEGRTQATADELEEVLAPALKRVGWTEVTPEQFLATIRDESGLLTGWSGDRFGFMHLGFQEYLAALELRSRAFGVANEPKAFGQRVRSIAEKFGKTWWNEVILLMLALDDPPLFEPLFREVVQRPEFATATELVTACAEDALATSPKPFVELLESDANGDDDLAARQVAAARFLSLTSPEDLARIEKKIERSANVELRGIATAAKTRRTLSADAIRSKRGDIEVVPIPAGSFWMGADPKIDGDEGFMKASMPLHRVTLSAFAMSPTPITNAQYRRFLEANPKAGEPEYWSDGTYNQDDQPVVGVSWKEASKFCGWAGVQLPTEAQWEYACRGQVRADKKDRTRFWCGDKSRLPDVAWFRENSGGRLHPVAQKPANPFGLFDMHGNVFEWCQDYWADAYPKDEARDPAGPASGAARVVRGGGFGFVANCCRSAYRSGDGPGDRGNDLGFRVVLPAAELRA